MFWQIWTAASRGATALDRGDVILVRPDGYVGFVGSLADADAIARYRSAAGCAVTAGSAVTGGRSSNVSDAPSLVAASASAGVS